ncbi:glycosyltransferase [Acidisoma cladoniae]|jgi:glycosyltransferase involved in cell wall biosynthesis|uniref:glycosyltransferase n=1 Tax=Acidisoma cladoniae TaxID=3040935 RepID=UPI00254F6B7A|nr:glycosyltransferase [Acidisoma sp. PAMC 29798]
MIDEIIVSKIKRLMRIPRQKLRTAVKILRYQRADLLPLLTRNLNPTRSARIRALEAELNAVRHAFPSQYAAPAILPASAIPEVGTVVVSVIIATDHSEPAYLAETIESLRWQTSPNWEAILCVVKAGPDGAPVSRPRQVPQTWRDSRVVQLAGASTSHGAALQQAARQAKGDFILVLDAGDLLVKDAISVLVAQIACYPDSIIIHGDEVRRGRAAPIDIVTKPAWSPDRLASYNYFGRPTALRRETVLRAGGYAETLGAAAEWDMALRLTVPFADSLRAPSLRHVSRVLCHRLHDSDRPQPHDTRSAPFRLVAERHWLRQGVLADIETLPDGIQHASWPIRQPPLVSAILADMHDAPSLRVLYRGMAEAVAAGAIELVIIDHGRQEPELLALHQAIQAAGGKVVRPAADGGYYRACNLAAATASGALLLFLRRGVEIHSSDWLAELVRHAIRPGVGVVAPRSKPVEPGRLAALGNPLGVAGPCHIVRRTVFERIGGYDERFQATHGEMAFCLSGRAFGYRTICLEEVLFSYDRHRSPEDSADDAAMLALRMDALGATDHLDPDPDLPVRATLPHRGDLPRQSRIPDLNDDHAMRCCLGRRVTDIIVEADGDRRIDDVLAAARFVITLLRRRDALSRLFPMALSDGVQGAFAQWLTRDDDESLGLDLREKCMIRKAFELDLSKRGRQVAFYSENLRTSEPLFLLPDGRCALAATLVVAVEAKLLTREELWWTLLQSAECVGAELMQTWLYTPEWQTAFPAGLNAAGKEHVVQWIHDRFKMDARLFDGLSWPLPARRKPSDPDPRVYQNDEVLQNPSVVNGVNIFAHFTYPSGLRASAESLVDSLQSCGVATSLRNVPVNLSWDEPEFERYSGLERYDVSIIHVQPEPYFTEVFARSGLRERSPMTYRIGYWYWESEDVPDAWDAAAATCDELWVATTFVSNALKSRYTKPVRVLPPGIQIPDFHLLARSHFGLPEETFVFLSVFHLTSAIERKNPLGLIAAFRAAFSGGDNVMLVIKTTYGCDHPMQLSSLRAAAVGLPIRIIDGVYDRGETLSLMSACDAYISLHRSEGLGLTMIEAMLLGKPTIATRYSGNTDFMNDSNSLLVDHRMVTLETDLPNYRRGLRWAQPSVDHAVVQMRYVFENRDAARALGLCGKSDLVETMSHRRAGAAMVRRLAEL